MAYTLRDVLRRMWVGAAITIVVIIAVVIVDIVFDPFGNLVGTQWGWAKVALGVLVSLMILRCAVHFSFGMAIVEHRIQYPALSQWVNVALEDSYSEPRDEWGWMLNMIPLVVASVILLIIIL